MLCGWVRCSKGHWVPGVTGSLELTGGEVLGFELMSFAHTAHALNYSALQSVDF
jgi:hypothetical protein